MDAKLLDSAGAEGVAGGDEDAVFVLQEEEADFAEVGGLADAVDADNGDDIGSWGRGSCGGTNGAEKVQGSGRSEDLGEGGLHGGANGIHYTC